MVDFYDKDPFHTSICNVGPGVASQTSGTLSFEQS
jgi:hypothetical protein